MKNKNDLRFLKYIISLVGLCLVLLNISGYFIKDEEGRITKPIVVSGYEGTPLGYFYSERPISDLIKFVNTPLRNPDYIWLKTAVETVSLTLTHQGVFIRPYENWMDWLIGKAYKPFGRPHLSDAQIIIKRGYGNCTEAMTLLKYICNKNGVPSRYIGLFNNHATGGHNLLEVKLNAKWIVVDPDFGIVFPISFDILQGHIGTVFIHNYLKDASFPRIFIDEYVSSFYGKDNDYILPEEYSSGVNQLKKITKYFKWIIPLIMLCFPFIKLKKPYFFNKRNIFLFSLGVIVFFYFFINKFEIAYKIKAAQNDKTAKFNLSLLYHSRALENIYRKNNSKNGEKFLRLAFKYCQEAAKEGKVEAQNKLGIVYYKGWWGQTVNYETALFWFLKAAEQNYADAQFFIGRLYENNNYKWHDYKKAKKWFELAARNGNAAAIYHSEELK